MENYDGLRIDLSRVIRRFRFNVFFLVNVCVPPWHVYLVIGPSGKINVHVCVHQH